MVISMSGLYLGYIGFIINNFYFKNVNKDTNKKIYLFIK